MSTNHAFLLPRSKSWSQSYETPRAASGMLGIYSHNRLELTARHFGNEAADDALPSVQISPFLSVYVTGWTTGPKFMADELVSDDFAECCRTFMQCTVSKDTRDQVLSSRDDDADMRMKRIQRWLDRAAMDHPFRRTAIHLLVGLAEQSGRFPPDLLVYYNEDLVIRMDIFKSSGYGDTYRGTYMTRDVIVKVMKPGQDSQAVYENKRRLRREVTIWWQLRHPHLVELMGIRKEVLILSGDVEVVMPFVSGWTLMDLVANSAFNVNIDGQPIVPVEADAKASTYDPRKHQDAILIQVAEAIHYLHSQSIVHGDIGGANILINNDMQVRLCDFGLTVIGQVTLARVATTTNPGGTPNWMAPERLSAAYRLHSPVDVYAFGCVCYAICSGRVPWYHLPPQESAVIHILRKERPRVPPEVAPDMFPCIGPDPGLSFWQMVSQCWSSDPEDRPHISTVLAHLGKQVAGPLPRSVLGTAKAINTFTPLSNEQNHITVLQGSEVQIFDMIGTKWLVRTREGIIGYVEAEFFEDPSFFVAEVTAGKVKSQPAPRLAATSRWTERGESPLKPLTISKGENVTVISVSERDWTVRDKHLNLGYIDCTILKVSDSSWPKYDKKILRTGKALCDFEPSRKASYFLSMKKNERFAYIPRDGDWLIAWRFTDLKRPGLVSSVHLRKYKEDTKPVEWMETSVV